MSAFFSGVYLSEAPDPLPLPVTHCMEGVGEPVRMLEGG